LATYLALSDLLALDSAVTYMMLILRSFRWEYITYIYIFILMIFWI